jgi:hypothetical protein
LNKQIIVVLLLIFLSSYILNAQEWQKCNRCKNPEVFYQLNPNDKDFKIKTSFVVNANIDTVLEKVIDYKNFPLWVYNCEEVEWCEKTESGFIYRQIISVPWPYKDSEAFLEIKINEFENSVIITQNCIPDYKDLNSKFERITRYKSVWKLSKLSETQTQIIWYAETGGPKNMSKAEKWLFLCYAPAKTINALRAFVEN